MEIGEKKFQLKLKLVRGAAEETLFKVKIKLLKRLMMMSLVEQDHPAQ